jgi:hypothetical protein
MRRLAAVIVPFTALVLASPLVAGTAVKLEQRDLPDGTVNPVLIDVQGDLVAISDAGNGSRMIFRGDRQQMLIIDDQKKTYMKLDPAMVAGVAKQVDAASAQVEAAISRLPADQQAMARRMMEQQQQRAQQAAQAQQQGTQTQQQAHVPQTSATTRAAAVADSKRVERTDATATREGYPCVKYEVYDGLVKTEELWVTDWSNVNGHDELEAAVKSLQDYSAKLTASLSRFGGAKLGTNEMSSWWHGIDGAPVVTTEFENGTAVKESVVRSVEAQSFPAATFEVPAGYTEQKIGSF